MSAPALNIKNDEAVTAVRRLADHYGTNCTQAIIRAADDILTWTSGERAEPRIRRIEAFVDECRATATHLDGTDDDMYDEDGLPVW